MIVCVDSRERKLIKLLKDKSIPIQIEQHDIGDIVIKHDGVSKVIIERKTISDLLSSIKDGRYREQMLRLTASCELHNHNIFYMIEGGFESNVWNRVSSSDQKLVHSIIFSITYYHGFSVLRTQSLNESADVLISMMDKLNRDTSRQPFYSDMRVCDAQSTPFDGPNSNPSLDYCNTIQKQKSKNITAQNINQIMLQQIPGVSPNIASVVLDAYSNSLPALIAAVQSDTNALIHLSYTNKTGKTNKINKTTIARITEYLRQHHPSLPADQITLLSDHDTVSDTNIDTNMDD